MKPISTTKVVLLQCLVFCLVFFSPSHLLKAQCYASSTLSCSSASNDNIIGTLGFLNTGNVMTSDNSSATATAVVSLFTGSSNYLKVTGFGFNISSFSSI